MKPIRVLVAHDHALIRAAIRALAEQVEGVKVVAETGNGHDAIKLIAEHRPQVVLLDLTMPELNGFGVLEQALPAYPDVNIIVLSVHEAEEYALRALKLGAKGYLPTSAAGYELERAIMTVNSGERYVSPELSRRSFLEHAQYSAQSRLRSSELTPRQLEVLTLISDGRTTKDIARELNISVKTVETHRAQLMDRLNIHDVAGLVRYALRRGLASIEGSLSGFP